MCFPSYNKLVQRERYVFKPTCLRIQSPPHVHHNGPNAKGPMGSDFPLLLHLMPPGPPHQSEIVRKFVLPLHSKGWDYIRVQVPNTWGPKHPLEYIIFGLKIGPKLEIWIPNLGRVYSRLRININWQESEAIVAPFHFFRTFDLDPSVNSLCTIYCSWLLGSHGFEVSRSWTLASTQPSWTIKEVQINNPLFIFFGSNTMFKNFKPWTTYKLVQLLVN